MGAERRPKGSDAIPDLGSPASKPERPPAFSNPPAASAPVAHGAAGHGPIFGSGTFDAGHAGDRDGFGEGGFDAGHTGAGGDALFGSGTFDADHFGGDSLDLALDATPALDTEGAGLGGADDVIERTAQAARSLPARAPADQRRWPTGVSPDSAAIDLDPSEVALTAEYGPAPSGHATVLPYAVRVLARRRVLRAEVREQNLLLAAAERERNELLASMISALRPALEESSDGRKLLEFVTRIETLAGEKRAALTTADAEYRKKSAAADSEAKAVQSELDARTRDVELARAVLAERREAHERAEARKKRLYIEVRGILDIVEKAGGKTSAAQGAQLERLEAEIAAQKPELERLERELAEATTAAARADEGSKEAARRAREATRRRTALAAEAHEEIGAYSLGLDEAEAHRLEAIVEAARGVLAAKGRVVDVPDATLDSIAKADENVRERARELERYVRAVDAYDHEATRRALVTASVLGAVLFIATLVLASR